MPPYFYLRPVSFYYAAHPLNLRDPRQPGGAHRAAKYYFGIRRDNRARRPGLARRKPWTKPMSASATVVSLASEAGRRADRAPMPTSRWPRPDPTRAARRRAGVAALS